jgi:hypothetical protein
MAMVVGSSFAMVELNKIKPPGFAGDIYSVHTRPHSLLTLSTQD